MPNVVITLFIFAYFVRPLSDEAVCDPILLYAFFNVWTSSIHNPFRNVYF
jgi:hypothetical protein